MDKVVILDDIVAEEERARQENANLVQTDPSGQTDTKPARFNGRLSHGPSKPKKPRKKALSKAEKERKARQLDELLQQTEAFSNILSQKTQALGRVGTALDGQTLGDHDELVMAQQPKCMVGGTMRDYQLEGLTWMYEICEQGMSGILADEMGLGKTVQTISLIALLREKENYYGPHLIVAPLSTLSNWIKEFRHWTPSLPVILYHGTPTERQDLWQDHVLRHYTGGRPTEAFPVICTSYEMILRDRAWLSKVRWEFIIIDEGHRMKNFDSRLFRELKSFTSATRLLITGTPLQNSLKELWSLLNFLLPNIFTDWEAFDSWFDFSELQDEAGTQQFITDREKHALVKKIHVVLQPLLLRRVKADVASHLPPKREYILYAPLTRLQNDLYTALMGPDAHAFLQEKIHERLRANQKYILDADSDSEDEPLLRRVDRKGKTDKKDEKKAKEEGENEEDEGENIEEAEEEEVTKVKMETKAEEEKVKESTVRPTRSRTARETTKCTGDAMDNAKGTGNGRPGAKGQAVPESRNRVRDTNAIPIRSSPASANKGRPGMAHGQSPNKNAFSMMMGVARKAKQGKTADKTTDKRTDGKMEKVKDQENTVHEASDRGKEKTKMIDSVNSSVDFPIHSLTPPTSTSSSPSPTNAPPGTQTRGKRKRTSDVFSPPPTKTLRSERTGGAATDSEVESKSESEPTSDPPSDSVLTSKSESSKVESLASTRRTRSKSTSQSQSQSQPQSTSKPISNGSKAKSRAKSKGQSKAKERSQRKGKGQSQLYSDSDSDANLSDGEFEAKLLEEFTQSSCPNDKRHPDRDRVKDAETILLEMAKKEASAKKLGNVLMQLRLVCNSPHHFVNPWSHPNVPLDESLVRESGKMLLLDRLLPDLFRRGHKVLIFSQFKLQLDLLQDYTELRGWTCCRLDGSVAQADRRAMIDDFNTNPDTRLFLLSTRAGGQGINLMAADTVILFDSDWNPQQDLQAQDRCHRIGQTRPVVVYRLATRGTVEESLLDSADAKRRLEKLVIQREGDKRDKRDARVQKGLDQTEANQTHGDGDGDGDDDANSVDLRSLLIRDGRVYEWQGDGQTVLTAEDLDVLCDRSAEAYARAAAGQGNASGFTVVETGADGIRKM